LNGPARSSTRTFKVAAGETIPDVHIVELRRHLQGLESSHPNGHERLYSSYLKFLNANNYSNSIEQNNEHSLYSGGVQNPDRPKPSNDGGVNFAKARIAISRSSCGTSPKIKPTNSVRDRNKKPL